MRKLPTHAPNAKMNPAVTSFGAMITTQVGRLANVEAVKFQLRRIGEPIRGD